MTTPEPRVRVSHVPWENFAFPWVRQCDGCKERAGYWLTMAVAVEDARIHAMECDSLRLAALIRELKALRDNWRAVGQAGLDAMPYTYRNLAHHWMYRADDLTAILDRAGGTEC